MKAIVWITALLALGVAVFLSGSEYHSRFGGIGGVQTVHAPPNGSAAPSPSAANIAVSAAALDDGYCCCSAAEVDAGTKAVLDVLNRITARPYFRYYKVRSDRPCPYWAVSLLCTSPDSLCDVCKCDENDVPVALREAADMSTVSGGGGGSGGEAAPTPGGDLSRAAPGPELALLQQTGMESWAGAALGGGGGADDDGAEYVDLIQNPEGNTGYGGPLAARVWRSIYEENCLSVEQEKGQCRELAVLRSLLSGMHFSISVHVSTNYYKDVNLTSPQRRDGIYNNPNISFYPNCDMYRRFIAPNGQFLGNLYVLYEFVLRALTIARPSFLADGATHVGAAGTVSQEDVALRADLEELFSSKLLCTKTFDETAFLLSPRAAQLAPSMSAMMHNVSTLMDCVACEKCRIWGKLEIKGIATALKVVMASGSAGGGAAAPPLLDRSEKVSLMNLARQVAFSVYSAQKLGDTCAQLEADKDK